MSSITRARLFALYGICAVFAACSGNEPSAPGDLSMNAVAAKTDFIQQLNDSRDFYAYAGKVGGSSVLKYTIQVKEPNAPVFFQNTSKYNFHADFLKTEFAKYANMSFEEYTRYIFGGPQEDGKELSAGTILYAESFQLAPGLPNGTVAFEYYMGTPGQALTGDVVKRNVDNIVAAHEKLADSIRFVDKKRIALLLPSSIRFSSNAAVQALKSKDVPILWDNPKLRNEFFGTGDIVAYHSARSYGYLKSLGAEDLAAGHYSSKDILVLDEIPLDLQPVSGIITSVPQVPLAHIMLRAINQNVPDLFVLGALEKPEIKAHLGKLVELTALEDNTYVVKGSEEISDIEARAAEYFKTRVKPLPPLQADLQVSTLLRWNEQPFDIQTVKAYGAKGTNFASLDRALRQSGVNRDEYQGGFLVPFSMYHDHVQTPLGAALCEKAAKACQKELGLPCQEPAASCSALGDRAASIRDFLSSMVKDSAAMNDTVQRRKQLAFARALVEKAEAKPVLIDTLRSAILAHYAPNVRIRFRSSTNAEDLPGLNGAGLYESKSACIQDDIDAANNVGADRGSACQTELEMKRIRDRLAKLDPVRDAVAIADMQKDLRQKYPLANAIRKVFASLWTDRAFLTRDYYNIEHMQVFMGVLAHPSFVDESANGVLVVSESSDGHELWVACQTEDFSITNPVMRGASPESFTVKRLGDGSLSPVAYSRRSTLLPGPVLSNEQIGSLARQATITHDDQKTNLTALFTGKTDIEFIVDVHGQVRIKQARPFPNTSGLRPDDND